MKVEKAFRRPEIQMVKNYTFFFIFAIIGCWLLLEINICMFVGQKGQKGHTFILKGQIAHEHVNLFITI